MTNRRIIGEHCAIFNIGYESGTPLEGNFRFPCACTYYYEVDENNNPVNRYYLFGSNVVKAEDIESRLGFHRSENIHQGWIDFARRTTSLMMEVFYRYMVADAKSVDGHLDPDCEFMQIESWLRQLLNILPICVKVISSFSEIPKEGLEGFVVAGLPVYANVLRTAAHGIVNYHATAIPGHIVMTDGTLYFQGDPDENSFYDELPDPIELYDRSLQLAYSEDDANLLIARNYGRELEHMLNSDCPVPQMIGFAHNHFYDLFRTMGMPVVI